MSCLLCTNINEIIIINNRLFRIVIIDNQDYPGYLNLITNKHFKELTDMSLIDAKKIFSAIYKIEQIIKIIYQCDKVNIFSFGNKVMHVHWHIVPRYINDKHFPNSIFGEIINPLYQPNLKIQNLEKELKLLLRTQFKETSL